MAHRSMSPQPKTIVLVVDSLEPDDVPGLIDRAGPGIVRGDTTIILCDLARLADADMATVDALARLALRARRMGCVVSLRDPSTELLELVGLADVGAIETATQDGNRLVVGLERHRKRVAVLAAVREREPRRVGESRRRPMDHLGDQRQRWRRGGRRRRRRRPRRRRRRGSRR